MSQSSFPPANADHSGETTANDSGEAAPLRRPQPSRFTRWLLAREEASADPHAHTQPWWRVMCLTGVDYFSTLGYQPGIAFLAAGALSPIATLVLVLLTLFGALPVYNWVARESPNGNGSISMLEKLLSWWQGKLFVLVLLGFVATDFVITITLSAADAAAHVIENPLVHQYVEGGQIWITLGLITMLAVVFLAGFREAVGIAVVLVIAYLSLNAVVVGKGLIEVINSPSDWQNWTSALTTRSSNPLLLVGYALLLFPKLALGLSGFETGVAVMPLVRGSSTDSLRKPQGRIQNTKKLLLSAAVIMSVFLLSSSFVTTMHIAPEAFAKGGEANGRALAYLAHEFFGDGFGTVYDISTILILWFAGSSAMAGLLNIVPRYLPRYGMAPDWALANRPLVLIFTGIAFVVTIIFKADVDAQGGAYATGVLVLMSSAAIAVTLSARKHRKHGAAIGFGIITVVFIYTTIVNILERPDGLRIAGFFIAAVVVVSFISRIFRSTELRVEKVVLDKKAQEFVDLACQHEIRIIANRRQAGDELEYLLKEQNQREDHHIEFQEPILFFEVDISDASNFSNTLEVEGVEVIGTNGEIYRILRVDSSVVPNAIAAFLFYIRDQTHLVPHCYFTWSEGNPLSHMLRYVLFGEGDTAPVTREIIRKHEDDPKKRPRIHAGG
jgi:hypothetical protein